MKSNGLTKKIFILGIVIFIVYLIINSVAALKDFEIIKEELISSDEIVECSKDCVKGEIYTECIYESWDDDTNCYSRERRCEEDNPSNIIYEKSSFTHTNPTATCFRIDSTIKTFTDMASVEWDGKEGINVEWRDLTFEEELSLREDREWKCKATFDWQLTVNRYRENVCNLVQVNKTELTWSIKFVKEREYWFDRYDWNGKTVQEDKEIIKEIKREKILLSPVAKKETTEKIFIHNVMSLNKENGNDEDCERYQRECDRWGECRDYNHYCR